jgi:hypothetical protein
MKLFGAGKPDHPMADPKEARRLLGELPAQDPAKALEELAHWHESVSAAEGFRPDARIQVHFSLDEAAQPRLRQLSRDYLAASRPSRFQQNRLWACVHGYHKQAGEAYARAVDGIIQGVKGAESAKPLLPLLLVRALRNLGQQIKWSHLRYGPCDASVWRILNGVYAFAESRGAADSSVPAVYPSAAGESSPRLEFLRAAMLSVSSPDSLVPTEVELAERLIGELAPGFALAAEGGAGLTHWTDLGQAMAPVRLAKLPERSPGLRFLGAGAALGSLQALMKRIEASGAPSQFEADAETALGVIEHLLLYWSSAAPERRHPRHNVKGRLSILSGFGGVVGALGASSPAEPIALSPEDWTVENVSAGGFGALVPPAKSDWLKIGALLAMQPDGGKNWVVGTVRRVSKTEKQETRVGIETLSRAPELARFALRAGNEMGVLLPAPGQGAGEAAIALRAGVFVAGQNLESERGGRSYVYLPQGVAEHGDDYDIVRYREMIRES